MILGSLNGYNWDWFEGREVGVEEYERSEKIIFFGKILDVNRLTLDYNRLHAFIFGKISYNN